MSTKGRPHGWSRCGRTPRTLQFDDSHHLLSHSAPCPNKPTYLTKQPGSILHPSSRSMILCGTHQAHPLRYTPWSIPAPRLACQLCNRSPLPFWHRLFGVNEDATATRWDKHFMSSPVKAKGRGGRSVWHSVPLIVGCVHLIAWTIRNLGVPKRGKFQSKYGVAVQALSTCQ